MKTRKIKPSQESNGAICGDGMCPYIPCKNFPKCGHLESQMEFERKFREV